MASFEDNMNKAFRSLVDDLIPKDAMLEKADRVSFIILVILSQ